MKKRKKVRKVARGAVVPTLGGVIDECGQSLSKLLMASERVAALRALVERYGGGLSARMPGEPI